MVDPLCYEPGIYTFDAGYRRPSSGTKHST